MHNSAQDKSEVYNDFINHCISWRRMIERGSKITSAHECTHGTNSELRHVREVSDIIKDENGMIQPRLVDGKRAFTMDASGEKINGFYVGNNKAIRLIEPRIRKSNVVPFVPRSLRGPRFSMYISGQTAWDDTPLYVFDEWVAYNNGVSTALDLNRLGFGDGRGTDQPAGPIEFIIYSLALCLAVQSGDPDYFSREPKFLPFVKSEMARSLKVYRDSIKIFPWPGAETLYNRLKSTEGTNLCNFLKNKLGIDPEPDQELDRENFDIV